MKDNELRLAILVLLQAPGAEPMDPAAIAAGLGLRGGGKKRLQKVLQSLTSEGEIVRIRGNRYTLGSEADLVTGRIEMSRGGDGFLNGIGGQCEAFVPRAFLGTALPGDRVVVRLEEDGAAPRDSRGRIGRVLRILERAQRELVGTLKQVGRFTCVAPMDARYKQDFYVPDAAGARVGDRVIVRFTAWLDAHASPEGEIVDVIGPSSKASTDTVAALRHFGIDPVFPVAVVDEAEQASRRMQRVGKRQDLTDRLVVTIDPERAKDFDDALSLSVDKEGRRVLGVHIADVSHFVRPGSALDQEARRRCTSVYLPDQVVPMLPEQLSNGVCSLRPDVERLAFSAFLTCDRQGKVVAAEFTRSRIRSGCRLTYEQVLPILKGDGDQTLGSEVVALLRGLHELAQQMRKLRFRRFALELETAECEISVDAEGNPTGVRLVYDDVSHQLVEECMLAANEAVARRLGETNVPAIYRVHAPPSPEKIDALMAELNSLGYTPGDLTKRRNMALFLRSIKGDARADYVRLAVLKSLNRAEYSEARSEHFGLAKDFYLHFTSPIRRYADLVVHRQLAGVLDAGQGKARRLPYATAELAGVARACSLSEQTADEAERMVKELKKYRLLQAQLDAGRPEVYDAVVVSVLNFGLFVEVPALQVQGLVHISSLSRQFVRFSAKDRSLRAGRERYGVETRLKVHVDSVDIEHRKLDFVPVGGKESRSR